MNDDETKMHSIQQKKVELGYRKYVNAYEIIKYLIPPPFCCHYGYVT
jgi:hypothetical protein